MSKVWRIHPHDPDRIAGLQRAAGIPGVVAQLLICRGTSDAAAARVFLDPKLSALREPQTLPGCALAAERLQSAMAAGKRIVVFGDYDVDGMTGTAILSRCLRLLGANVGTHLPHRIDEGYGVTCESLRRLVGEGAEVLVTVDCGIGCIEEAELARQLGVEFIVTDHHEPGANLPNASAIVHPRLGDGAYPFGGLCGAGVAFKLAWALAQAAEGATRVSPRMRDFLVQAVGLAALGTVADVVPLVDENRVLVRHGLISLKQQPTLGMAALLKVTGLDQKPNLESEDIAFQIAPRLNAVGRLGQPQLGLELLVTDKPERAAELAQYIHQLNETRQTLERSIQLAANKQVKEQFDAENDPAFVLADRDWHPGIIGIVAGRLAEKYQRPVALVSFDTMGSRPGIGSARSVPGIDLHAALGQCSDLLLKHGGHAAAAGLKVAEDQLEAFRAAFCDAVATATAGQPVVAELSIDAEAPLGAFTPEVVHQIQRLAPFGAGNARPLLCATGVTLAEPPKTMGNGGHHLQLRLAQHGVTLRAVAFGGAEWSDELGALDQPIDIAFRPVINSFRGRNNVELHLVDWRRGV
jgi:single-stranded-DNA-specific exonuclease